MASAKAGSTGWFRGRVKAVTSGTACQHSQVLTFCCLFSKARKGGVDEPFAWDSREYLRKLCIGKEVTFKVDYTVPSIGREFGSVFLGDKNVAMLVVAEGWAKVREQGQQNGRQAPFWQNCYVLKSKLSKMGLAKYVKWSANLMEEEVKRRLKAAELQAKKSQLRYWTNYVPPPSNSKAICYQNFSGTVVEVVSGDCIVVADGSAPYGSSMAERRVKVLMEYSRMVSLADGASTAAGAADSRVMDFGSVCLVSPLNVHGDDAA
ncbi:hypothetical protein NL676_003678 [Syzygium grande]|nr:hypothetical protein NL676_003678 [Syzygium grande]